MPLPAIAVAGAGAIGRKHAAILASGLGGRLACIVDPFPGADAVAAQLGVRRVDGLGDLGPGVDGVILATPTALHASQALNCIRMGLPVLVEKPVAASLPEAVRLADAAARSGVPVLVGHHRRHNPVIARARKIIADGTLGRIVAVSGTVLLNKPDDYFNVEWRRQPGAGPLLTNLIHEVDTLRHLAGEVTEVMAMTGHAQRGFAIEDTAAIALRLDHGGLASFAVSDATVSPWSWEATSAENPDYPQTGQSCLLLAGREASLDIPGLRLWHHDGRPRGWFTPLVVSESATAAEDPLVNQIAHFAAVIGGAAPLVTVIDAARSLAVVEAVMRSAESGRAEVPTLP